MKQNFLIFFLFVLCFANAQEHAWVYFNDKPNTASAMANPLSMLTQRALDRRTRQNIALNNQDVPISNSYINQIMAQNGILVKAKSKWLNAVHVFGTAADINALSSLNFVSQIIFADNSLNARPTNQESSQDTNTKFEVLTNYNYGNSYNQAHQIRVDYLHEQNFTGTTMQIAVLDAGFPNVDNFSAFQQIRDNNQILGGYDFVSRSTNFYQGSSHGTAVLSTIAGFVDTELVGTAPDVKVYLFRTEDAIPETPLEESLWVEAAEKADSLGVDIISTSLGYQDFDEHRYDHQYSDMDGNTTFISRGANIAALKGILVIAAAGNDGNNTYFNISSPADATNVFTVGAVDENGVIANFSSYGPNFNNQIKPDVDAKGSQATVINSSGNVSTSNGTSFATPIMAGAVACFWEAYPNKTNFEIMQMIRESASLYNSPTNQEGYGIPNFETAFQTANTTNIALAELTVFPNPVKDKIHISIKHNYSIEIYSILGKKMSFKTDEINRTIDVSSFEKGIYFLKIKNQKGKSKTVKMIKQ